MEVLFHLDGTGRCPALQVVVQFPLSRHGEGGDGRYLLRRKAFSLKDPGAVGIDGVRVAVVVFLDFVFAAGVVVEGAQHRLVAAIVADGLLIIDDVPQADDIVCELLPLGGGKMAFPAFQHGISDVLPVIVTLPYLFQDHPHIGFCMRFVKGERVGILVLVVGEECPAVFLGTFDQLSLYRVVVAVSDDGPHLFVTQLGRTSKGVAEQIAFLLPLFVPFIGKQVGVCLVEGYHLIPVVCHDDLMRMIRHRTQGQDAHAPLPCLTAVDGKIDQIIVDGIEDNTSVSGPLEHVMHFSGVNDSFFHAFFVSQDRR